MGSAPAQRGLEVRNTRKAQSFAKMGRLLTRSPLPWDSLSSSQTDFVYPTVGYELSDVLNDLMEFSAAHLRLGGRLVFWLPLIRDTNHMQSYPQHPLLKLISSCEQPF